jgi:hypothetical protein
MLLCRSKLFANDFSEKGVTSPCIRSPITAPRTIAAITAKDRKYEENPVGSTSVCADELCWLSFANGAIPDIEKFYAQANDVKKIHKLLYRVNKILYTYRTGTPIYWVV